MNRKPVRKSTAYSQDQHFGRNGMIMIHKCCGRKSRCASAVLFNELLPLTNRSVLLCFGDMSHAE
jgi:hypothetical protein